MSLSPELENEFLTLLLLLEEDPLEISSSQIPLTSSLINILSQNNNVNNNFLRRKALTYFETVIRRILYNDIRSNPLALCHSSYQFFSRFTKILNRLYYESNDLISLKSGCKIIVSLISYEIFHDFLFQESLNLIPFFIDILNSNAG